MGKSCNQSTSVAGESSKPPMELLVLPEALTIVLSPVHCPDQVPEPFPSYPTRVSRVSKSGKGSASRNGSVVDVFDEIGRAHV